MEFNKKGFPIIRLHENYFEVKAIDYWEFRAFKYSEVIEITYYHNKEKWLPSISLYSLASFDPYKLKIKKVNGADWSYSVHRVYSKEFAKVIKELLIRCGLERTN